MKLISTSIFALILMFPAMSSAQTMSLLIDPSLNELTTKKCFQDWTRDLEEEGYFINYHSLPKEEQNLENYKSIITQDEPSVVFLLGDLNLPKLNLIQRDKLNRSRNTIVNTETLLPLMSLSKFPKNGKTTSGHFYQNANITIGALNMIYHRVPNYSHKGLISQYCQYFSKATKYKNCERAETLNIGSMVDTDFKQLENDIFHLNKESKKYSSLDDLIINNNLDFSFLAAHANSKKIYYGKGEKKQTLSISNLLKKKISTRFYNLYSCRVLEDNGKYNIGKSFFGSHSETLGIIGSTKSGALAYPQIYFNLLKKGYSFAEALRRYIKFYALKYGGTESYLDNNGYHGGLVFYGDPTLDLHACKEI